MSGDAFYWLADNISVWSRPMAMVLAMLIIGLLHLVAIGLRD